MVNKYYVSDERRAERVSALFTAVANRYDLINDLQSFGLHRSWKRRLVRMAEARGGEVALDLCCGTGDIAIALAERRVRVAGLDFNERMLARASARTRAMGFPLQLLRGDAQRIPFRNDSFDIVSVGYGLRNLASWSAGLLEMARVARSGGKLLVLEFGKPANPFLRALYFTYLRAFVPLLGLVFCGNPAAYSYILESLKHYPAQRGIAAEMRKLGLKNVQIVDLLGGIMSINYGEKP